MIAPIDNPRMSRAPNAVGRPRAHIAQQTLDLHVESGKKGKKAWGSAQPFEKAHFRQENPRKSRLFSLILFGGTWPGLAGFGKLWIRLGKPQSARAKPPWICCLRLHICT
jgi:hypothetical protein